VCRHWRSAIASTPSSWTWINPKWGEQLPLLLRLSGSAPIDVEVSNLENFSPAFIDLFLSRRERIASFTLAFSAATRGYCSQIISGLRWMPNLRLLSILAEPGLSPCSLPILSRDMPHLKSITPHFFPYGRQIVQLTHLTSINIAVDYSTLADVIRLFANNPELRSATLCGTFSDESCRWRHGTVGPPLVGRNLPPTIPRLERCSHPRVRSSLWPGDSWSWRPLPPQTPRSYQT